MDLRLLADKLVYFDGIVNISCFLNDSLSSPSVDIFDRFPIGYNYEVGVNLGIAAEEFTESNTTSTLSPMAISE